MFHLTPSPPLQMAGPEAGPEDGVNATAGPEGQRLASIQGRETPAEAPTAPCRQSSSASIADRQRHLRLRLVRGCIASNVVLLTVMLCIAVIVRTPAGRHDGLASVVTETYVRYGIMTFVAGLAAATILVLGSTPHFRTVAACLCFVWLQMWSRTARYGLALDRTLPKASRTILHACYSVSWAVVSVLACVAVKARTEALQARLCGEGLRSKALRMSYSTVSLLVLVASLMLYGLSFLLCDYTESTTIYPAHVEVWQLPLLVTFSFVACSYSIFAGISCHGFFWAWRVAVGVSAVAKGRLKDDARQAKWTLFFQLLGTCLSFSTTIASVSAYVATRAMSLHVSIPFLRPLRGLGDAFAIADASANILLALALAGVFSGSLFGAFVKERLEFRRRLLRSHSAATATLSENPDWNSTLEQLADRGITLQALLGFYKGLGKDYMLHYDSECHTTLDVVRQAIIPLSSDKSVAYASIMMKGEPTRPEKMVTHAWGNLFRDLVGAVISDALCESEYAMVAFLMDHDIEILERWIHAVDKQSSAYWICAFSVNQHANICGQNFGGRRDSVTGELHPTCKCSHEKILNETPPCFGGKSILCEVNKFDDFMALMASSSASFQQVVAVDKDFNLFSRAWCVAELAVAAKMGLRQTVKVHSRHTLDLKLDELKTLRIEAMHASREEDKAEILNKIPDTDTFNKELRSLLVERLFPSWHSLDPTDQMLRMSSLGRWYHVSKTKSLDRIWEVGACQATRPG